MKSGVRRKELDRLISIEYSKLWTPNQKRGLYHEEDRSHYQAI
jgi:hypothetical protein